MRKHSSKDETRDIKKDDKNQNQHITIGSNRIQRSGSLNEKQQQKNQDNQDDEKQLNFTNEDDINEKDNQNQNKLNRQDIITQSKQKTNNSKQNISNNKPPQYKSKTQIRKKEDQQQSEQKDKKTPIQIGDNQQNSKEEQKCVNVVSSKIGKENVQGQANKSNALIEQQAKQIKDLEEKLTAVNREKYELGVKQKEEKLEIKRLKSKICTLESEMDTLQNDLKEKNNIIKMGLENILKQQNQNQQQNYQQFDQRRDFVLCAQLAKQKRYIQHLIKIIKQNQIIQTELEYQLNYMSDLLEKDILQQNKDENYNVQLEQNQEEEGEDNIVQQKKVLIKNKPIFEGKVNFQKLKSFHLSIVSLQQKLQDLVRQCKVQFSANILQEYDQTQGKIPSRSGQFSLQLQNKANKILLALQSILNPPLINKDENNILKAQNYVREFINQCLESGLDVFVDCESEFEKPKNSTLGKQESLQSVNDKIDCVSNQLARMQIDNYILNFASEIQVDRSYIIKKYSTPCFTQSLINYWRQTEYQNISTNCSINNSTISVSSSQQNSSKDKDKSPAKNPQYKMMAKKKQIKQNIEELIIQALDKTLNCDIEFLEKQNSLMRLMLMETQRMLASLNNFAKEKFTEIEKFIRKQLFEPLQDIYQIYEKYYKNDKSQNYSINLAQIYNIHTEQIQQALCNLIVVSQDEIFREIDKQENPLIQVCYKEYQELVKQQHQEFMTQ